MENQRDLFGEETHEVQIKDNQVLERACNRLLEMVKNNPKLLDGNTMKEIDNKLYAEILFNECFKSLIKPERKSVFIEAMLKAPDAEVFSRARRELLSRGLIRINAKAVLDAERHRARISGAMR
jgi:hypothetical protein